MAPGLWLAPCPSAEPSTSMVFDHMILQSVSTDAPKSLAELGGTKEPRSGSAVSGVGTLEPRRVLLCLEGLCP